MSSSYISWQKQARKFLIEIDGKRFCYAWPRKAAEKALEEELLRRKVEAQKLEEEEAKVLEQVTIVANPVKNATPECMDVERFKAVDGFPGYKISSWGRVWSDKRKSFLKPCRHTGGYPLVGPYRGGKRSTKLVHRLVASAFISNPKKLLQVDHVDHDPVNNSVVNLRWCSPSQNQHNRTKVEGKCGVMGVRWIKRVQKFRAQITGRKLGYFKTRDEAELVRLRAELERDDKFMPTKHRSRLLELEKKLKSI